ncbi:mRNA-decapping enzyme-like protein [Hibiscus syriacus]|uniref:mRNA-decapping enzyme-like protein n=1 Tax=Hibiscus syriacus TaxID=106335 RepID=UPI00192356FB|nr:mRNA-decapping enzyme-like protein [Hibiscus syriacus]
MSKLLPNLDQQSTKLLNLTVLRRIDPFIEEILFTAAHVAFYDFNIDLSQWSRKDVEGSLFVVKRNTQPRFQFIVMNRCNTDNLVENLLGDFEYEVQDKYLLYRNASQEINGIWFYDARELEEVANLFGRILSAYSKVPQKSKATTTKSEFEELEAAPTVAIMDRPLEPSLSTVSNAADASDDHAFVNFFSTVKSVGSGSNVAVSGQSYQSSVAMPAALSNPAVVASPTQSALQLLSLSSSTTSKPLNTPECNSNYTNLVKPSTFFGPPSSSAQILTHVSASLPTSLLNPPPSLQRPYGAPLLQPFPPPTPSPSLTPALPLQNYGLIVNKEKVRDTLFALVQDDQFIDMVHGALLNAHIS